MQVLNPLLKTETVSVQRTQQLPSRNLMNLMKTPPSMSQSTCRCWTVGWSLISQARLKVKKRSSILKSRQAQPNLTTWTKRSSRCCRQRLRKRCLRSDQVPTTRRTTMATTGSASRLPPTGSNWTILVLRKKPLLSLSKLRVTTRKLLPKQGPIPE